LGPEESGKSTIFKQMKIIQKNGGFSKEELNSYRYIVFVNCLTQMKILVNASIKLNIQMSSPDVHAVRERFSRYPPTADIWSPEVAKDIQILWSDKGIRETYDQKDKIFQLNDSSPYFFDNVLRFGDPSYLPTEQDVLRSRVRTTGIEEAIFCFEDMSFRMVDVGGQRAERRKWIHCFDSVTAVVFCASLSDYDQTLREDNSMNRMKESLNLFDEICNSPWFRETSLILFLNKADLLKEKIQKIDLKCCFENYTGGHDYTAASTFIRARFLEQNQSPHTIYAHFTCAVDTQNVEIVFKSVRDTLLKSVMNEIVL